MFFNTATCHRRQNQLLKLFLNELGVMNREALQSVGFMSFKGLKIFWSSLTVALYINGSDNLAAVITYKLNSEFIMYLQFPSITDKGQLFQLFTLCYHETVSSSKGPTLQKWLFHPFQKPAYSISTSLVENAKFVHPSPINATHQL